VLFVVIVTILVKPLGGYVERVFSGKRTVLDRLCRSVSGFIYRITTVDPNVEMTGKEYATCFVLFGFAGTAPVVWHSQTATISSVVLSAVPHDTIVPRPGSKYSDQFLDDHDMAGLRWREHDELFQPDGGTLRGELPGWRCGLAVGVAFIRGLARQLSDTLGNFGSI